MSNKQLADIAQLVLNKRPVQFGSPRTVLRDKAYAQALPFITYPWVEDSGDNQTMPTQTQASGPDGILLPAGGQVIFQVPIGTAGPFHMLYIKYHIRSGYETNSNRGALSYLGGTEASMQNGKSYFDASYNQQIFFHQHVGVSLFINSGGGRNIYGGLQRAADSSSFEEIPLNVAALQDDNDGLMTLRIPYQLAAGSTVKIGMKSLLSFESTSYQLYVNGAIMGYRIMI